MADQHETIQDFFMTPPPEHNITVGALVTCTCHDGIAIVVELYDLHSTGKLPMDMAKIWWVTKPKDKDVRTWMHTIRRLKKLN